MTVGSDYDPMLAKVIAHADDRADALRSLDRALAETAVLGVGTNVEFLRFLLTDADVVSGRLDTSLLDRRSAEFQARYADDDEFIAAAAYRWLLRWSTSSTDLWDMPSGWRIGAAAPTSVRLRSGARTDHVHITGSPHRATAVVEGGVTHSLSAKLVSDVLTVTVDDVHRRYAVAAEGQQIWLACDGRSLLLEEVREAPVRADDEHSGDAELTSPMPGSVVAVAVADGERVAAGAVVVAVEAMKMEHPITAPIDGVVELLVSVGDQVKVGQPLARIAAIKGQPES
jgi:acetyl-CoA/propionyl-CoA carboxylase biotin carboxyl carrier protein